MKEKSKGSGTFFWVLLALACAGRFAFLDMDHPSWFVSSLCAEDEPYYCASGVLKYVTEKNPDVSVMYNPEFRGLTLYSDLPVYFSLKLMGNNFWGLRVWPVTASIFTVFLICGILRRLVTNKWIFYAGIVMVCCDFSFLLYSRYQGPQIYSILCAALVLWLVVNERLGPKWQVFLIALVAFSSISIVYIYNAYLFFASGMFIIVRAWTFKSWKMLFFAAWGVVAGVVLYLGMLSLSDSSFGEVLETMLKHGGGMGKENAEFHLVKNSVSAVLALFINVMFRYNLPLLLLFIIAFTPLFSGIRKISPTNFFMLMVFVFAVAQFAVAPSYPYKKMVVLFPTTVAFVFYNIDCMLRSPVGKRSLVLMGVLGVVGLLCVFMNYRVMNSSLFHSFYVDAMGNFTAVPQFLLMLQLIAAIFGAVLLILGARGKRIGKSLFLLTVPALSFVVYYLVINRTYQIRDALIAQRQFVGKKLILGDFTLYYQFYSEGLPFYNYYNLKFRHPGMLQRVTDSVFTRQGNAFEIHKALVRSPFYKRKRDDLVNVEGRNYQVLGNYAVPNYSYVLVKRVPI